MMRIAIIDDEEYNRSIIKTVVQRHFPLILVVVEEEAVEAAIKKINLEKPDLVFLDVKLNGGTGFDVIGNLEYKPKVIFTTAYSEFAVRAIKVKAFNYLLKPIDDDELVACVRELLQLNSQERIASRKNTEIGMDFYHYATNAGKMSIRKSDILFFQSSGSYTYIVSDNQRIIVSKSIGEIELELTDSIFYRTHNSFIVNITKIKNIDVKRGGYITLKNDQVVPISQRKVKDFLNFIGTSK